MPSNMQDIAREYVASLDKMASQDFIDTFQMYAGTIGTNNLSVIALRHTLGVNCSANMFTLHIQIATLDQSLAIFPVLDETSLENIEEWLDEEYDLTLDFPDIEYSGCELVLDRDVLCIRETLIDTDGFPMSPNYLQFRSCEEVDKAVRLINQIDDNRFDNGNPVQTQRTTTLFGFPAETPACSGCGEPMLRVLVIIDDICVNTEEKARGFQNCRLHAENYQEFVLLLRWLGRSGVVGDIVDHNVIEKDKKMVMDSLNESMKDEFAAMNMIAESIDSLAEQLMGIIDAIKPSPENGDTTPPTVH